MWELSCNKKDYLYNYTIRIPVTQKPITQSLDHKTGRTLYKLWKKYDQPEKTREKDGSVNFFPNIQDDQANSMKVLMAGLAGDHDFKSAKQKLSISKSYRVYGKKKQDRTRQGRETERDVM